MATFDSFRLAGPAFPSTLSHATSLVYVHREPTDGTLIWIVLRIRVQKGTLCIDCESSAPVAPSLVWIAAQSATDSVVAAVGFASGSSPTARITRYDVGAGWVEFKAHIPGLSAIDIAEGHLIALATTHGEIEQALLDFQASIERPHDTALHVYRGVESVRSMFGRDDASGWNAMHAALGTSRAHLAPLVDAATEARHGERLSVSEVIPSYRPPAEWTEARRRAAWGTLREVIRRAAHFVLRGGTDPLPEALFPRLTEPHEGWDEGAG